MQTRNRQPPPGSIRMSQQSSLRKLAILVLFCCTALVVRAQDSGSQDKGSIGGTVVDGVTQQPIRGAEVTLRGPMGTQAGSAQSATSDGDGHFVFNNLSAGRYMVWASHSGYLGRGGFGERGRNMHVLLPGQHLDDATVTLLPGAVIAGHVVDEKGKPLMAASVHVMKASSQHGMREVNDVGQSVTDASGEFHFKGLNPGDYILYASYTPKANTKPAQGYSYVPICYPSTTDFSSCDQFTVRAGEEMAGIDLTFTPIRAFHIKGTIMNSGTGSPSGDGQVSLLIEQKGALVSLSDVTADAKGSFHFPAVAAGNYTIVAQHEAESNNDRALWGMKTFSVSDTSVDNLKMEVAPGVELRGHVRVESNSPADLASVVVSLEPVMNSALLALTPQPEDANVRPDGSFAFHDVLEGTYRINASPLPQGMYLKASNPEALDAGMQIGHTPMAIDLTFSPGVGKIQGTVSGDSCARIPVLLVPDGREGLDPRDYRRAASDQSCRFIFRNIAPGAYRVMAFDSLSGTAMMNPDFVRQYQDQGESVQLKEGGEASVQVGVISLGDSSQ